MNHTRIEWVKQKAKNFKQQFLQSRTGTFTRVHGELEMPAVMRTNRHQATVEAMKQSGVETLDIPSFLRKQAD